MAQERQKTEWDEIESDRHISRSQAGRSDGDRLRKAACRCCSGRAEAVSACGLSLGQLNALSHVSLGCTPAHDEKLTEYTAASRYRTPFLMMEPEARNFLRSRSLSMVTRKGTGCLAHARSPPGRISDRRRVTRPAVFDFTTQQARKMSNEKLK
ncbi:hypothetical protein SKAU_G00200760 [Synaphobranchus kaupii]|uniref:Uncharacterized protein n=1 Tax=Synaphobranchus kaupii TaxID=118154 RepID=A0A9Q1FFE6_SYNKA|nr:hypothetical protein SKAU_G00200760 [Synaphobranchus kaupii]